MLGLEWVKKENMCWWRWYVRVEKRESDGGMCVHVWKLVSGGAH